MIESADNKGKAIKLTNNSIIADQETAQNTISVLPVDSETLAPIQEPTSPENDRDTEVQKFIHDRIWASAFLPYKTDLETLAYDAEQLGLTVELDQSKKGLLTITEGQPPESGKRYVLRDGRLVSHTTFRGARNLDEVVDCVRKYEVTSVPGGNEVLTVHEAQFLAGQAGEVPFIENIYVPCVPVDESDHRVQFYVARHQTKAQRVAGGPMEPAIMRYDPPEGWKRREFAEQLLPPKKND